MTDPLTKKEFEEYEAKTLGKLDVKYQECFMSDIIKHYIKTSKNAHKIHDFEWFYDQQKNVVIYKLFVRQQNNIDAEYESAKADLSR